MNASARKQVAARPELALVLSCQWCHQDIELASSDLGSQIVDVAAFLAVHRDCLTRGGFPAQHTEGQD